MHVLRSLFALFIAAYLGAASQAQPFPQESRTYAQKLILAIKKNIVLAESVPGNPEAVVEVDTQAGGAITNIRLVQSSGYAAWDRAVLMALARTERLPLDNEGRAPPRLQISFRPNEANP